MGAKYCVVCWNKSCYNGIDEAVPAQKILTERKVVFVHIVFACKPGFQIRSVSDAEEFLKEVLQPGSVEIPDADDSTLYHAFVKEESGRVLLGSARYGSNPLVAEPPCCTDADILQRTYQIRKSINLQLK